MKLSDFLQLKIFQENQLQLIRDGEFFGINLDARLIQKNELFAAVRGTHNDGHKFIDQAIQNGATCILISDLNFKPHNFSGGILYIQETSTFTVRQVTEALATHFYNKPSEKLFCVGVTGTNGKTSTTYILEHILNHDGVKTGVIGTINHHCGDQVWHTNLTTPDPINLQSRLAQFLSLNAKALAIEVSSHALDQSRVDSINFDCAIFSNLTRDHLDYHHDMDSYFKAKKKLFDTVLEKSNKKNKYAIVNIDDPYGQKIDVSQNIKKITFGQNESDLQFKITNTDFTKTTFTLKYKKSEHQFILPMVGAHNVYNAVSAIAAAICYGLKIESIKLSLQSFSGVPGRLQLVSKPSTLVSHINCFVDYAHSPDALENVLKTLTKIKSQVEQNLPTEIWTIFGCGGDRDKGKRPLMAQVAQKYSDYVMVTSDNPRTEDPILIIEDIKRGLQINENVFIQEDRKRAIEFVINKTKLSKKNIVILIAGKGHEDYQIIGTTKHQFSDYDIASSLLNQH